MEDTDGAYCTKVRVTGVVQGVFFRSTMKSVADKNNVVGWVRNLADGSVEALLQGKRPRVEKVISWCRKGPEKAKVDSVNVQQVPCNQELGNFAILY